MKLDNCRTLLLNSSGQPLAIVSWKRALELGFQDKVTVLETYEGLVARSPSRSFPIPAVMVLKQYLRFRPFRVTYGKKNVFLRDGYTCQYCGCQPGTNNLTLDHVVPSSRGGKSCWTNVATACEPCNHRKANRTPKEAQMTLRSAPMRPTPGVAPVTGMRTPPVEWGHYLATG